MNEQLELVVVDGRKKGARIGLSLGEVATTIGVSYDCDIILDLPGVYQPAGDDNQVDLHSLSPVVQLNADTGVLTLKVLDGSASVGDQLIEAGKELTLEKNVLVKILDNIFTVEDKAHAVSHVSSAVDSLNDYSQQNELEHQPIATREDNYAVELHESEPEQKKRLLAGAMQSLAGVLVLGGAVLAYLNFGQESSMTIDDVVSEVRTDLEIGGFEALSVASQEDNSVKVNGYLQSRSDLQRARSLVQAADVVQWDVRLGESLADSVDSVFRVNGLTAEVALVEEGVVAVNTATGDHELLERVEQSAYADVAGLQKLELANEEPVVEIQEPERDPIESLPGKRIVMIVATKPTYLQTEDGSRYFEGSILPSGHMITAILDETVHLEFEDEQIELTF